mmetsp:Transcript_47150/g.52538  ORF Transcript_47150/g.52538 Transcript_47150/m.52538 type:complete len:103 (-) Transcript_47150:61-369(-)
MYDTYRPLPRRSWTINNIGKKRKNDDNNKKSSLLLLIDSFIPTYSIQYSADTQAVFYIRRHQRYTYIYTHTYWKLFPFHSNYLHLHFYLIYVHHKQQQRTYI